MIKNEFSWFELWWKVVQQSLERRPSALLLLGPKGTGKSEFALELAAAWLCQSPLPNRSACGQCPSCNWMKTGQHPDFRWIRPEADAAEDAQPGAEEAPLAEATETAADTKKKSQEIRIEQIRGISGFANVGSHRGGLRVALIDPVNRMNYAAANALLKTLEEPAESLAFILVADSLRGIPATILSRCRRIALDVPAQWRAELQTAANEAAPWLLPLLAAGEPVDPIRWAEKGGKSPPGDALELLMRWMADAARVQQGAAPRSFADPTSQSGLKAQALRIRSPQTWTQTMAELQGLRAIAEHPLNPKLFYESIFDRLRRASIA